MKIIAINGSPHGKRGSCSYLIGQMFEECEKLGAETEMVRLIKHKIDYCLGCGKCMSDGVCPIKDDVKEIQDKIQEADGIVYASPVYVGHISGLLKNFIDRCFAIAHRPSFHDKYAAAVSAFAGIGDIDMVADYMLNHLAGQGAYPVGKVCAFTLNIKVSEDDQEKARQLGRDMVEAFDRQKKFDWEKQRKTSKGFKDLETFITKRKDLAKEDYRYWKEKGWIEK
jgi:multimeric flavodoxin WrbA